MRIKLQIMRKVVNFRERQDDSRHKMKIKMLKLLEKYIYFTRIVIKL